jgi:lipopolysaccharide/colanic/teichoic acid biosynthesis glycosyltransferase
LIDIAVGIATCVLALPVMLLIAAITLTESGRPVFFSQERLGQFRRPFVLRKFRTMIQNAEAGGPQWSGNADPRVTRFGGFLRATHLDELPQAWNLLRGDMTLIGPRPIRRVFADRLRGLAPLYNARFLLRPGVTGWPQVLGPYGKDEQEQIIKLEMDLYYLAHGTLLDDAYILARTVRKVVGRHEH